MTAASPGPATLPVELIEQAATWFVRLNEPDATSADRRAWAAWIEADDAHRQAWGRIALVQARMSQVPAAVGLSVLTRQGAQSKRAALRFGLFAVLGPPAAWFITTHFHADTGATAMSTRTGERRNVDLPDGSRLVLNTATSIRIDFDSRLRRVTLERGEIWVETSPDPLQQKRSFVVDTPHGRVLALGTRFTVRGFEDRSVVAVDAHAVRVSPSLAPGHSATVSAGHRLSFGRGQLGPVQVADPDGFAWRSGTLVAVDRPMDELVRELARYRPGYLDCDPALGRFKVSGSFGLDNTGQAL